MKECFSKCFKRKNEKSSTYSSSITTNTENFRDSRELKMLSNTLSSSARTYLTFAIESSVLFKSALPELLFPLPKQFKFFIIYPTKEVITQSKTSEYLFILSSGQADILQNKKKVGECKPGEFLEEFEFLFNQGNKCTVRAKDKCMFWGLHRDFCIEIFESLKESYYTQIKNFLSNSIFFRFLADKVKLEISQLPYLLSYNAEQMIIQDEVNEFVFLVFDGSVKVINNSSTSLLRQGEVFGRSLFVNSNVKKTNKKYVSNTQSKIVVFKFSELKMGVGLDYKENYVASIIFNTLIKDEVFAEILPGSLNNIAKTFKTVEFLAGKVVISNSNVLKSKVVILCSGEIASSNHVFKAPQLLGYFKEEFNVLGTGKFIASTDSIIAELPIIEIDKILQTPFSQFVNEAKALKEIRNLKFFNTIQKSHLLPLIRYTNKISYKIGAWIYKSNKPADTFYYIIQGSVGLYERGEFVFRIDEENLLGETCLILNKRQNSAKALAPTLCYEFEKDAFERYINDKITSCVKKTLYFESSFTLGDIEILEPYSTVKSRLYSIGLKIDTKMKFLVESINKKKVYNSRLFWMIVEQKCAVAQIYHPLIQRFIRTLSDGKSVYFFYEYFEHFTLDCCISQKLNSNAAKFIIISLAGILDYLHNKDILHRNICPGNIAIDINGYVKLTGFKYIKECKSRSYTVLDTSPIYKAKETIIGAGYSKASEYWSLGIILYEMLTCKLPFDINPNDGVLETAEKVKNNNLIIPESVSDSDAEIIKELLNESNNKRLQEDILQHCWASPFKFNDIVVENTVPPYKPSGNIARFNEKIESKFGRKLSLRSNMNSLPTEQCEELEWDRYF